MNKLDIICGHHVSVGHVRVFITNGCADWCQANTLCMTTNYMPQIMLPLLAHHTTLLTNSYHMKILSSILHSRLSHENNEMVICFCLAAIVHTVVREPELIMELMKVPKINNERE